MNPMELLSRLAREETTKIVLLVLDGVGDLRTAEQPRTALEAATTPHLDALAHDGALGRLVPVLPGVTPGSGPGHLGLFGYDPAEPRFDIGRGVLEALGLGLEFGPEVLTARGNFATADADGLLTDRRAGRPPTADTRQLTARLNEAIGDVDGVAVELAPGESHRFVLLLRGDDLRAELADTDPQATGEPPLTVAAQVPEAAATAERVAAVVERIHRQIADEPRCNRVLLRGFSKLPDLPQLGDLYRLRCGAFAGYPLYRGVASACGMQVFECGKQLDEVVAAVRPHWSDLDYCFLHIKQTDAAGEDGDLDAKVAALEAVDHHLPALLDLRPDVLAVTGDHSTPVPMRAHSWHPIPLLLHGRSVFVDDTDAWDERQAVRGHLGDLRSSELMGMLLAHAGRLAKYGA